MSGFSVISKALISITRATYMSHCDGTVSNARTEFFIATKLRMVRNAAAIASINFSTKSLTEERTGEARYYMV